jgi:hypothetical protein
MKRTQSKPAFVALLVCAAACAVAGCSGDPPPPATFPVEGKVTFGGQPVTEGTVSFYNNEKGLAYHGPVGPDGTYKLSAQPAKYSVVVNPPPPPPNPNAEAGGKPPAEKEYPNIPEKFRQATTSGLTTEVREGPGKFDIAM